MHPVITFNPIGFTILALALLALLGWATLKIIRLSRNNGEPGWERGKVDPDGRSLYDRMTNFLNYPWS